jgi:hypothetical protein
VNKRSIALKLAALCTVAALFLAACSRINESTDLGGGLIPPVDNINTFDTSIRVQTFNEIFLPAGDSQAVLRNDLHYLGLINNDPFFGKTDARLFLELKPSFYPFYFGSGFKDSIFFDQAMDSVVLVLDYIDVYGDTTVPQTVSVYELDPTVKFRQDSAYLIRENSFTYSSLLGSKTFLPKDLDDSVKAFRDTTRSQLRIKLDKNFGRRLLDYDSTKNAATGAYSSDSAFRSKFKGFALQSVGGGNAVMGFNLAGVNTKLAFYYRYQKAGKIDTTVTYLNFTLTSANANYIQRDYSGTPVQAAAGGTTEDDIVYLQNTPGTYANIKIPDLNLVSNRVIHRAELIIEQLYHISDSMFYPPQVLYLDAADPSITRPYKFRTIPYDLTFSSAGTPNLTGLGCLPVAATDASGNRIRTWRFNISRYIQHFLTRTQSLYDLRLTAPFYITESFGIPPGTDVYPTLYLNPTIVKGRIRVGGGNHPAQRMRLRLIYSKL